MQRPKRQPSSRQHPIDFGDPEGQDLAPARRAAFEARYAFPKFEQYEMGRGRGHVRRSRLQFGMFYFCSHQQKSQSDS
jgi:hypothetical protein